VVDLCQESGNQASQGNIEVINCKLNNTSINFKGGKIRCFIEIWRTLTSDSTILGYIKGVHIPINIDFDDLPMPKKELKFSHEEKIAVKKKIDEFLKSGIIEKVTDPGEEPSVISNFFLRTKPDGNFRFILNLKPFNALIDKTKFKLTSLRAALKLVKRNCYFAKLDFKDGYYSINVHEQSRAFFRFEHNGEIFQFCCLPQGYTDAVRIFTKVMKPPLAHLRGLGHINVGYIDDTLLIGYTFDECFKNVIDTTIIFDKLGFTIHIKKSVFEPTQIIDFLGFTINSIFMIVKPTEKRAQDLREVCKNMLRKSRMSIRELAQGIGKMVAMSDGNKYAPLFFKRLEILRNKSLEKEKGNYDALVSLNEEVISDIEWWIENVDRFPQPIQKPSFTVEMYTDASGQGFGVKFGHLETKGLWTGEEKGWHVNIQELTAIKIGLLTFLNEKRGEHIHVFTDSSVAVSCISRFGSCKPHLNDITRDIWIHCMNRDNFITASHIAGKHNIIADKLSRNHRIELEWKLNPAIFNLLSLVRGPFQIDLFASRVNFQMKPYISWHPDPDAFFIDAFHFNWSAMYGYCFPPFSLIPQILQKVQEDEADICIIVPFWKNQNFFPVLGRLLVDYPLLLPNKKNLLINPTDPKSQHSIIYRLHLTACKLSGKPCKVAEFQQKARISLSQGGDQGLSNNTRPTQQNGFNFVVNGVTIPALQLLER